MKRKSLHRSRPSKALAVCAATCVAGAAFSAAQSAAQTPPDTGSEPEKAETDYRNWFTISVGNSFIDGDKAAFQERHQTPKDAFGGVEEFHYEQDVGKQGLFTVEGRGLLGSEDYKLRLSIEHPEIGYIRGGFREYRTWYDGSGGYFPRSDSWFSIYDEQLAIDRGEIWFEGGLTLPDKPELWIRYSHQYRDGRKDSTIWGDAALPGGAGQRAIVPSFRDIDEERDIIQIGGKHQIGETTLGLGLAYETSTQDNSLNIRRRPGDVTAPAGQNPPDRYLTQREGLEADLFNIHAFSETWFNEKTLFTTGYSFTTMDTDISGSRIYGADYDSLYDPGFGRRQQRDEGFLNLSGGSRLNQHVMNLNFMFLPLEHLSVVPSLRVEKQEQEGFAVFDETNFGAASGGYAEMRDTLYNTRDRGFVDVSERLEVRYTGLTNWVLYTRGEWLQGQGDLTERELDLTSGTEALFRDTDTSRFTQKYVAGVNWYPARRFNASAQYYHKIRANEYDHDADTTGNLAGGNRYPAFIRDHDFQTDDVNFRVTLRPLKSVTLVSRYDLQHSTIDSRMDGLDKIESSDQTAHIFSQSITWVPFNRFFLQASGNYALDTLETPAAGITNAIENAENDYWTLTTMAGFVLTEKTDLQAQYTYYRADNYNPAIINTVPLGAGAEEHGIIGTIIHRFTPRMQWTVRYGFFRNREEMSGYRNDYDAHIAHSSFRYLF